MRSALRSLRSLGPSGTTAFVTAVAGLRQNLYGATSAPIRRFASDRQSSQSARRYEKCPPNQKNKRRVLRLKSDDFCCFQRDLSDARRFPV